MEKAPNSTEEPLLLTIAEAAKLCNVKRSLAYKLAKGEWPVIRLGPSIIRIPRKDLETWIARKTIQPSAQRLAGPIPREALHAILSAMGNIYAPGNHHTPSVQLFGTCRVSGLNEASCVALAKELYQLFPDMHDDPSPSIAATYAQPLDDGVATLAEDYPTEHYAVAYTIKSWLQEKP